MASAVPIRPEKTRASASEVKAIQAVKAFMKVKTGVE
jgi:hypothetical protein